MVAVNFYRQSERHTGPNIAPLAGRYSSTSTVCNEHARAGQSLKTVGGVPEAIDIFAREVVPAVLRTKHEGNLNMQLEKAHEAMKQRGFEAWPFYV